MVLRRLGLFIVALALLSVVIFAALHLLPGDVAAVIAGTNSTPEKIARIRTQFGLDRPLWRQYLDWIGGLLHGDLGASVLTGRNANEQIAARAQVTFPLIILGMLVTVVLGVGLGTLAAVLGDKAQLTVRWLPLVIGSIPALWGGLLLILLFAKGVGVLGVLPAQGFPLEGWADPGRALASLVLPALSVGVIAGAQLMRFTRSALFEIIDGDAVRMAMACGMTRAQAIAGTGLRMVAPQLVSVIGLTFAEMITGVLIVENLFALPGLASMLLVDVGNRDLLRVQGELMALSSFFLLVGFVVDLLHRLLDPRLRRAEEA